MHLNPFRNILIFPAGYSFNNMTVCGLSLHQGNTESHKNSEQNLTFKIGTLAPHGINERLSFH